MILRDIEDLLALLRTLDEACGTDDRQFRWRVRQLRAQLLNAEQRGQGGLTNA